MPKSKQPPILPVNEHSDQQLLLLIQQKSASAFETLYYRYYASLCAKAFSRLQNETLVEEIVQDVFVNFWNKAAQLDAQGNIAAYLFATLRYKVLYELRSQTSLLKKQQEYHYLQKTMESWEGMDGEQTARESVERMKKVLAKLPPKCREAFVLSRGSDLSYQQIAKQMNISVKTVEKHIGKALRLLRAELGEKELCFVVLLIPAFISA